jgi:hypothetical protein
VSAYKPEQCRLTVRGRELHFVSYEGREANDRRGETEMPAMWYLMCEGKRCPAIPHVVDQPPAEVDLALRLWAETNVFGSVVQFPAGTRARRAPTDQRNDWWAPK